jgi:hypothetical protein
MPQHFLAVGPRVKPEDDGDVGILCCCAWFDKLTMRELVWLQGTSNSNADACHDVSGYRAAHPFPSW